MGKFLKGLSQLDKQKYKSLSEKFKEIESIDQKKKFIPHLILLREKGMNELTKRSKNI